MPGKHRRQQGRGPFWVRPLIIKLSGDDYSLFPFSCSSNWLWRRLSMWTLRSLRCGYAAAEQGVPLAAQSTPYLQGFKTSFWT